MKMMKRADALRLGKRYYITGRPCPYDHYSRRYAKNGSCVQCQVEGAKRRYEENKHVILAKKKAKYHSLKCAEAIA